MLVIKKINASSFNKRKTLMLSYLLFTAFSASSFANDRHIDDKEKMTQGARLAEKDFSIDGYTQSHEASSFIQQQALNKNISINLLKKTHKQLYVRKPSLFTFLVASSSLLAGDFLSFASANNVIENNTPAELDLAAAPFSKSQSGFSSEQYETLRSLREEFKTPGEDSDRQEISIQDIAQKIKKHGFVHIQSLMFNETLTSPNWIHFKNTWNNLSQDTHMGDFGDYRFRRYSVLSWSKETKQISLEKHQPHYQDAAYNELNGNKERDFDPFEKKTLSNHYLNKYLTFASTVCSGIYGDSDWHIEAHQYRILAKNNTLGKPTPEGIHQDGRDCVFITFMGKDNIIGGTTSIYPSKDIPSSFERTMNDFSETFIVNDRSVFHDVSGIQQLDSNKVGSRDVLVVTLRQKTKLSDVA